MLLVQVASRIYLSLLDYFRQLADFSLLEMFCYKCQYILDIIR